MAATKVAIQGDRGAFSEVAARSLLGENIAPVTCNSFESLFDTVENKHARYGVVPIENSLVGSIHRTYDLLLERSLQIIGETQLRVVHCLIGPKGSTVRNLKTVFSHPVALDQCRNFFTANKHLKPIPFYDTAGAVRMLAEEQPENAGAIAGPLTADLYGMKLVRKSIEDEKSNHTRFLLLGRNRRKVTGNSKTSVVFSFKNQPGALFKMLSVFALRDINLTKIESRPVRHKTWSYYFYVDFEGHVTDPVVKRALEHLRELTLFIKILGSYPLTVDRA